MYRFRRERYEGSFKRGIDESIIFQHKDKPLCFALWSGNSVVKTLYGFHYPIVCAEGVGVLQKKRGEDGRRDQHRTEVSFPQQNKYYSKTFHLIDKGNGAEEKYDMGGHSKGHNWLPKLTMRFFNMSMKNEYKITSH